VDSYRPDQLNPKKIFDFLPSIRPNLIMREHNKKGDVVFEITEGEVLERWKKFFILKKIPWIITKERGVFILWKEKYVQD